MTDINNELNNIDEQDFNKKFGSVLNWLSTVNFQLDLIRTDLNNILILLPRQENKEAVKEVFQLNKIYKFALTPDEIKVKQDKFIQVMSEVKKLYADEYGLYLSVVDFLANKEKKA